MSAQDKQMEALQKRCNEAEQKYNALYHDWHHLVCIATEEGGVPCDHKYAMEKAIFKIRDQYAELKFAQKQLAVIKEIVK
jgi:hypothetical protein